MSFNHTQTNYTGNPNSGDSGTFILNSGDIGGPFPKKPPFYFRMGSRFFSMTIVSPDLMDSIRKVVGVVVNHVMQFLPISNSQDLLNEVLRNVTFPPQHIQVYGARRRPREEELFMALAVPQYQPAHANPLVENAPVANQEAAVAEQAAEELEETETEDEELTDEENEEEPLIQPQIQPQIQPPSIDTAINAHKYFEVFLPSEDLSRIVNPNIQNKVTGETLLHIAIRNKNWKFAELLLSHPKRLNLNLRDTIKKETVLEAAMPQGNQSLTLKLLSYPGVRVNSIHPKTGKTLLHLAIELGQWQVAYKLLSLPNVSRTRQCKNGFTPLHQAVLRLSPKIGRQLNRDDGALITNSNFESLYNRVKFILAVSRPVFSNFSPLNITNGDGWTPLHYATFYGDYLTAKSLVQSGASLHERTRDGDLPFHVALLKEHLSLFTVLLPEQDGSSPGGVDVLGKDERTALHMVAKGGKERSVRLLLQHGASKDKFDSREGNTPFHLAAKHGHAHILRDLIPTDGVDVQNKEGDTALMLAARYGHLEAVKTLVSLGADKSVRSFQKQNTPLHEAAFYGHSKIIEHLTIEEGLDVLNQNDETPLMLALTNQKINTAIQLVKLGAQPSFSNDKGICSIHVAAMHGCINFIKRLIEINSAYEMDAQNNEGNAIVHFDMDAQDYEGNTPLHYAIMKGQLDTVGYLSETFFLNKTIANHLGFLPFHIAAEKGYVNLIQGFKPQDIDLPVHDGNTALHLATLSGHQEAVEVLKSLGARIDIQNENGSLPFHLAAQKGFNKLFPLLVPEEGYDVQDSAGSTAMHYAALSNQLPAIGSLRARGAKIEIQNALGQTPLHIAVMNAHKDLIPALASPITINIQDAKGNTPLHLVAGTGMKTVLDKLDEYHPSKTRVNGDGNTPLHVALLINKFYYLDKFISEEALTIQNNRGQTPLHLAAIAGNCGFISKLIEKGAQLGVQDQEGHTPLHVALKQERIFQDPIVRIIEACSNEILMRENNRGETPLQLIEELNDPTLNALLPTDFKKKNSYT